ncbi:ribosome-associated translation inhibitor RaiA [Peptacetobacter hominis]|uniref:Ribosome hibernation promoting factor n=1 Tax=Peptacetobacter hominis TaxID=2743610 RepID=A0A544QYK6_9FIRM|nr:ribosome-associated translation inhibitor RaiA [Peptacetobacter hominis]TQQ85730.1 ribosome-associated translation inhibitor RaiA [Peptacetobacter hominis]
MKVTVSARHMKLTDGIKGYTEEKLKRLGKYLDPDTEVRVTVSAKKDSQKVEITIPNVNGRTIRVEEEQENLYPAIDMVCDTLSRQIVKYKTKFKTRVPGNFSIRYEGIEELAQELDYEPEEPEMVIERRKKFALKPMSPEEAILQMDLVGHDFYMFRDRDSFEICVVYKRKEGGYGLIEHEE